MVQQACFLPSESFRPPWGNGLRLQAANAPRDDPQVAFVAPVQVRSSWWSRIEANWPRSSRKLQRDRIGTDHAAHSNNRNRLYEVQIIKEDEDEVCSNTVAIGTNLDWLC